MIPRWGQSVGATVKAITAYMRQTRNKANRNKGKFAKHTRQYKAESGEMLTAKAYVYVSADGKDEDEMDFASTDY